MAEKCRACNGTGFEPVEQTCDECGRFWEDGIAGCPHCGAGNPFKGIHCLAPSTARAALAPLQKEDPTNG